MSEKLMAGLVTALVIAPVCSLCILGPAALAAFFGGLVGWLDGFDLLTIVGLAAMVGVLVMINKRYAAKLSSTPGKSAPAPLTVNPEK